MTKQRRPTPPGAPAVASAVIPELPRAESEAAFARFVDEVELTEEDDAAIRARIERMAALGTSDDAGDDNDDDDDE